MREFTLKVSYERLQSLVNTLESNTELRTYHQDRIEIILEALVADLIIRFRKKLLTHQSKYSFKLKMHEALGMVEALRFCSALGPYEINEINQINSSIHRHYA
jgi:hypothetical protein